MADVERAGGCGEESCDYCCTLMGCGVRGDFCPFQPNDTKSVKYWKGSNGSYLHKQIFPFSYPCLKATILVFKVFSARDRKLIENELVKGKQKHFPIQSWIPGQCCNFLALLQELSYRVRKGPLANTYPVEHPSLSVQWTLAFMSVLHAWALCFAIRWIVALLLCGNALLIHLK